MTLPALQKLLRAVTREFGECPGWQEMLLLAWAEYERAEKAFAPDLASTCQFRKTSADRLAGPELMSLVQQQRRLAI